MEVGGLLGASRLDGGVGLLGEVANLLGGGGLVGGVGLVGEGEQTLHLLVHNAVLLELGSLVGDHHGGDILDLTDHTLLGLLGESLGLGNAGGHLLAGIRHIVGGGLTGGGE